MAQKCAIGLISALAASASFSKSNIASADGPPLTFSAFSTSPTPQPQQGSATPPAAGSGEESDAPPRIRNDNPRTTSAGFDPEALERGAKTVKGINNSAHAKKVFERIKTQEETRQAEFAAKAQEFKALQSQAEAERQRVIHEEQKKLAQHQAQTKAQMARYEDELARKRMQAENEAQRTRNQELVRMQEESAIRREGARRATEEEIQAQRRQTEREKAEIERETIRVKAMAEAEGRARESKLSEDVNRRMLVDRANAEREKWVSAINTTFDHIGGGLRMILTDQNKLVVAVGGITALAAGIYTTREGAKVIWSYVDRVLGQPSLIRESSRGKYPWSGSVSRALSTLKGGGKEAASTNGKGFGDVILHPSLQKRIEQLASATANTKSHQAPFRNMLFYGPPGTGKTMAARELARKSGLDYALMTGGDVAPLGAQAVTKIHQLFDWSKKSKRGLLLFIDEADAFLCERNKTYMSEAQRSALNALLFRTGDQSKDIVLALATNRPGDLDSAVADRVDETLEFPLPGEEERFKLLNLYLDKYITKTNLKKPGLLQSLFKKDQLKIEVKGVTEDLLKEAAAKTKGFSGRGLSRTRRQQLKTQRRSPERHRFVAKMLSSSPTSFTHPFLSTSPPLSPISPPSRSPRLPPPLVSASCSYTCTEDPPRLHQIPRRTTPANASLYEILEVPRGATSQDIKSAYRRLARICHPDVAAGTDRSNSSADEFMKIHAAYCTLSDPDKRSVYDRRMLRRSRPLTVSTSGMGSYVGRNWETDQCW